MFGKVYQGFYKDFYIRSSYEYVYVKVLEKLNIPFEMEMITYQFEDGSYYTPDFFILDDNNDVIDIIEIKAEDKEYYQEGLITNQKMFDEFGITVTMFTIHDLRPICRSCGLSFDQLSSEWKSSSNSSKIKDNHGIRNPMYGRQHSELSKEKNGLKTKQRFLYDESFRQLHSDKVKEAMQKVDKEKLKFSNRSKNKIIKCCICGKLEQVYTSQSIYCNECREKYTPYQRSKMKKVS